MYDPTPAVFGDVTRRWTALDNNQRQEHAARLLGHRCGSDALAHVDRPGLDDGACYHRLVPAAAAGDPIAIAWLATTHRPLLIARGRPLLDHDPTEWGAVCLEVLHRTLASEDLSEPRWLRRRVARKLINRLYRVAAQHLKRRGWEYPTDAASLRAREDAVPDWDGDPHPDLTLHLDRALHNLDEPTRESLLALANHEPLAEIAARHGLSYAAVRQRVTRGPPAAATRVRRLSPDGVLVGHRHTTGLDSPGAPRRACPALRDPWLARPAAAHPALQLLKISWTVPAISLATGRRGDPPEIPDTSDPWTSDARVAGPTDRPWPRRFRESPWG
jgi:DNA-directed RNA polymerase specialized sigma24 family protein